MTAALRVLRSRARSLVANVWREPTRAVRRKVRHWWHELRIRRSGLFDSRWYAKTYPEVAATGLHPLTHFVRLGAAKGFDPNPWFDTRFYVERNPRAVIRGRNPLVHYLGHPTRDPHPAFSTEEYLAAHPELAASRSSPLLHFLRSSARGALSEARRRLATGVMNRGWYGGNPIRGLPLEPGVAPLDELLASEIDRTDTKAILRYVNHGMRGGEAGGAPSLLARSLLPLAQVERQLTEVPPPSKARPIDGSPSFSVVTPFYRHRQFLDPCAMSVLDLAARSEGAALEWILVNDDPAFTSSELEEAVPLSLRPLTRVLSDGHRRGIVARLNQAICTARHDWILFLDCDDLISADAIVVIRRYIERFPACRYISSAMIDVDESGEVLRYRRRTTGPALLLEEGMTAGHLKAVRRDTFDDHGMLDPAFEGCQDYEFALRLALEEPLLYVPEYLYAYRWHRRSQSVASSARQTRIADAVVRRHGLRLVGSRERRELGGATEALPQSGVAVVRTQGRRNDLLAEALLSLRKQALPVVAMVVVHGDVQQFEAVRRVTEGIPGVERLHAPDTGRRRGHPLNVALSRLYESSDSFGFVCFLDDDDILYPLFSSTMHEALVTADADLVYAASNRRIPWQPAEAGYAPLPAPCLLVENSIPINSYAIRFDALRRTRLLFDEELEYLEDWDFLVRAFGSGLRFLPIADVLSEFRVIGDGNLRKKNHPRLWEGCLARIRPGFARVAREVGRRRLLEQLLDFPAHMLENLDEESKRTVHAARAFIDAECPAEPPVREAAS